MIVDLVFKRTCVPKTLTMDVLRLVSLESGGPVAGSFLPGDPGRTLCLGITWLDAWMSCD